MGVSEGQHLSCLWGMLERPSVVSRAWAYERLMAPSVSEDPFAMRNEESTLGSSQPSPAISAKPLTIAGNHSTRIMAGWGIGTSL